jgi:uncharacterized delta-60 repeat protein
MSGRRAEITSTSTQLEHSLLVVWDTPMRAARLIGLALTAQLVAAPASVAAPPHAGSFDRSFGHNGRVTLDVANQRIAPSVLAVQPDGKIVVAGTAVGPPGEFPDAFTGAPVALRFMPDGALDTGFGDGGIARAQSPRRIVIQGLAFQPDGKLLLSGIDWTDPGDRIGAVVRFLPSGAADGTFGTGGVALLPDAAPPGYTRGVKSLTRLAFQADGRIVAAGSQDPLDVHSSADPYVARLMPDGAPDTSFDEDGRASIGTANPIAVIVQPSGDAVVVGSDVEYFGTTYLTLLGIAPGANAFPYPHNPSPTFVSHHYRTSFTGVAAAGRPDGAIAVVGEMVNYSRSRNTKFLARARIGPDLQLVGRGKVATRGGVLAAAFDARGAALTAGTWLTPYDPPPYRIERYRGMRRLDRSFGARDGKRYVYFERPASLLGMAMQGDELIVAGYTFEKEKYGLGPRLLSLVRLHARQDGSGPIITVRGLPRRGCVERGAELRVIARDESRVTVRVLVDRHGLTRTRRHRFGVSLGGAQLDPGVHKLRVRAVDAAGNLGATSRTIRVCG